MSQQARVGLLVLAGAMLFLLAIFAVANRSFLFSDTFFIRSQYNEIAGLQPGASVQYQGYNIGRVESISLPERAGGMITVTMAIQEEARHLIHENTRALIKSSGLVGNQIIVLDNPAQQALGPPVEEGEYIPGVDPFDLFEITDKALASVATFEDVALDAQEIMRDIKNAEGTLGQLIYDPGLYNSLVATSQEAEETMATLGESAEELVAAAEQATAGVNSILAKVNDGEGTLSLLLNDPAVYNQLLATSDSLLTLTNNLESVLQSSENAANWGALGAYRFAELMEAAKHNFFFKGYFEDRGYFEKAPFEIREQAIEESYQQLQDLRRRLEDREARLDALEERLEALREGEEPAASARPMPGDDTAVPETSASAPDTSFTPAAGPSPNAP